MEAKTIEKPPTQDIPSKGFFVKMKEFPSFLSVMFAFGIFMMAIFSYFHAVINTKFEDSEKFFNVKFEVLEADITEMKVDIAGLKTDVVDLKTDVSEIKTDVLILKSDMAGLKSDMAEIKQLLKRR